MARGRGWHGEPGRHSAAARGIPTKSKRKKRFAITLARIPSPAEPEYWMDEPFKERKVIEVEARYMDIAAKRAEKLASNGEEWRHVRVREL